jgi:hypothetical protein
VKDFARAKIDAVGAPNEKRHGQRDVNDVLEAPGLPRGKLIEDGLRPGFYCDRHTDVP